MNQVRIFRKGKRNYDLDYSLNGSRHTLDGAGTEEKSISQVIIGLLKEYNVTSYVFLESYTYDHGHPVSREFLGKIKRRICRNLKGIEVMVL